MSDHIRGSYRELHEMVGVEAGGIYDGKRNVPVVTVTFCKDRSALADLEDGIYDPDDGRWHNFSMTIRAARQMIGDLNEMIDQAVAGPDQPGETDAR